MIVCHPLLSALSQENLIFCDNALFIFAERRSKVVDCLSSFA
nr:MAG TPA: hypothetical protein [Caudoviricetes sp.]